MVIEKKTKCLNCKQYGYIHEQHICNSNICLHNQLYHMDCMEGMKLIGDNSIDMILCDLPYGVTDCKWDTIIPYSELWEQYNRIIKDNGAIILSAIQPFTTRLILSNIKKFRYCWYWVKNTATGFTFAKYQPMRKVEDILVFYKRAPTYNPQGLKEITPKKRIKKPNVNGIYKSDSLLSEYIQKYTGYPNNVLEFDKERGLHPTQKPVALFEYLIRTYTNENDIVLDNCMGSGTTAIACMNTNRIYVGFEKSKTYFDIAMQRIDDLKKGTVSPETK